MTDKQALYLKTPEIPTAENFDQLLDKFGGATFSVEPDSWNLDTDAQNPPEANETSRYEYGVPVQTEDAFLRLPSPVVSSWCSDANPAGWKVHLNPNFFALYYSALRLVSQKAGTLPMENSAKGSQADDFQITSVSLFCLVF